MMFDEQLSVFGLYNGMFFQAPGIGPGQAFRPLALEQLALLTLEQGDRDGALQQAQALLQEPDLTDGLRRRVAQLIVVLGGVPGDLG